MDPDSRRGPASAGLTDDFDDCGAAVVITEARWRRIVPRAEAIAARAARIAGGAGAVVLASDLAVRRLNARHRGQNKPTNVLTFDGGDIILALGVVQREARAAGRLVSHHLAHLVVHGALHLRGHDHDLPRDARRMEMAETRLLHRMGVPDPWRTRRPVP